MKRALCGWICIAAAASSCVLPSYDKVGSKPSPDDGGPKGGPKPTLSAPRGASESCAACLSTSCPESWSSCGADCQQLTMPITPVTPAPQTIDPFLACMQDNCEAECNLNWGCVGQYRWPTRKDDYTVTLRVVDMISSFGLGNVHVTACHNSDPSCSEGSGLSGIGDTDATGHATLAIPSDFNGFFSLQPNRGSDYLPTIAVWTQPTYVINEGFTQRMLPVGVAESLATGTSSTLMREMSHLIFRAQNCLPLRYLDSEAPRALADDVTVTFTPPATTSSRVFYAGNTLAIDPEIKGTSHEGESFGGAFNLPALTISVIGSHKDTVVARAGVQMRAGAVSFVYLVPGVR